MRLFLVLPYKRGQNSADAKLQKVSHVAGSVA